VHRMRHQLQRHATALRAPGARSSPGPGSARSAPPACGVRRR
jgi:hypothetical protein